MPISAARSAATATPVATRIFPGTAKASIVMSGGPQLGDRGAQPEGDHEVEEREAEEHGNRVAQPRPPHDLRAISPEDECRRHREGQREERAELLELEEDRV